MPQITFLNLVSKMIFKIIFDKKTFSEYLHPVALLQAPAQAHQNN